MADRLKEHIYHYDEIVIGNNLSAILYAYERDCYFIYNTSQNMCPLDSIGLSIKLGEELYPPDTKKRTIAAELVYDLVLKGKSSVSGKIQAIRVEDEEIKVITENSKLIKIKYDKLRIFNLDKISSLPIHVRESTTDYRVLDWYDVKSGMKHEHDFLTDNSSSFVNKIHFYTSERIDGNTRGYKDLVAESLLDRDQINDASYSDSISRLKILDMMKEAGITGTGNGKDTKGRQRYLPIKIELSRREVFPNRKISCEEESEKIIIDTRELEEIYRSLNE